ncbi:MAG TPA: MauE/DoxX family redox-associated membrane protein [Solirubrobacteraceae bacterium]|jgi:uncharacterized membrane protein YphA (DoxX/SURF4 family)|nr:MauE/DoxX family redox-associated membrane protein [Solirubrobacteraceae bacterium]
MAAILTSPIAVAALVLATAGVAKLRAPAAARHALAAAGLSVPRGALRLVAAVEVGLALLVLLAPARATCALLAAMYAALAIVAGVLARRGAACGCFGGDDAPTTRAHVGLSAALALAAAGGVVWPPHGVDWLLERAPGVAAPLALGIAGAAYATVLAYTLLPAAWSAWRPR